MLRHCQDGGLHIGCLGIGAAMIRVSVTIRLAPLRYRYLSCHGDSVCARRHSAALGRAWRDAIRGIRAAGPLRRRQPRTARAAQGGVLMALHQHLRPAGARPGA